MRDGGKSRAWNIQSATHVRLKTDLYESTNAGVFPCAVQLQGLKKVSETGDTLTILYATRRTVIVKTSKGACKLSSGEYEIFSPEV